MYGDKYVLMLPGWSLEVNELWHDVPAPCGTDIAVKVLENSLYTQTIRVADDVDSISYNGVVSMSVCRGVCLSVCLSGSQMCQ